MENNKEQEEPTQIIIECGNCEEKVLHQISDIQRGTIDKGKEVLFISTIFPKCNTEMGILMQALKQALLTSFGGNLIKMNNAVKEARDKILLDATPPKPTPAKPRKPRKPRKTKV